MRAKRLIGTIAITLLFSLLITMPVLADEIAPDGAIPEEEESVEQPAVDEETPIEEPAPSDEVDPEGGAESVIPEGDEAVEQPVVEEESPVEEPAPAEETVSEGEALKESDLATELADDGLELAAPGGEALDLASQETALALSAPDPYFKVGTTTYRFFEAAGACSAYPGDPYCFDTQGPDVIQDVVDYIETNGTIPSDRKIYVEGAHTYSGGVTVDGTLNNLDSLKGLIGVDGSANTTITGDITLTDLVSGFTLQGFKINGKVQAYDNTGTITLKDLNVTNTSGIGIVVGAPANYQDGAVVIENVNSSGNSEEGVRIENDQNGTAYNITIKNLVVDENCTSANCWGLHIQTLGKVSIDGISASRNRGAGIGLYTDFSALTIKNASIASNDDNPSSTITDFGLYAYTSKKATITLDNVYIIDSKDDTPALRLYTAGNVTLKNVHVTENADDGAYINTTAGTGTVKIYNSTFGDNNGNGLYVLSKGSVYLSSIKANDNTYLGAFIDTCQDSGGGCTTFGTVTITSPGSMGVFGANEFSRNGNDGLEITSGGAISITNFVADGNTSDGIDANNSSGKGGITIKKTIKSTDYFTFMNSASNNGQDGLSFDSGGAIAVDYVVSYKNLHDGIDLNNQNGPKAFSARVRYSEANENGRVGIRIMSDGSITLTNVLANENGTGGSYTGAYLNTTNGTSGSVTISSSKNFINQFNDNTDRGLHIEALGNISLTRVECIANADYNRIENHTAASPKNVKITYGWFNETIGNYGLHILSHGSVKLDYVNANDNDEGGVIIGLSTPASTVSVRYSTFNRNDFGGSTYDGLVVNSLKTISLYSVSASENGAVGVYLDNCQVSGSDCVGTGGINIKSKKGVYNTFIGNDSYGLYARSAGSISVSYVHAENNTGDGMRLDGNWYDSSGKLSVSANSTSPNLLHNNGGYGLYARSNGTVSIKYIDAFNNDDGGGYIYNENSLAAKSIYVGESAFNKNLETGLEIYSGGTVTLQGVEASDNSAFNEPTLLTFSGDFIKDVLSHTYGPDTWKFSGTAGAAIDIQLYSFFFDAYVELRDSSGALIYSDDNSGVGTNAHINGATHTLPATDTYTIVAMSMDGGGGGYLLNLNSGSTMTQDNIYGIEINNTYGTGSVTVKYSSKRRYGVRTWNNTFDGINIQSDGAVSISKSEVMFNGERGIDINNYDDTEKSVKLTDVSVEGSFGSGVYVRSDGDITLTKVHCLNNYATGAYLLNSSSEKEGFVKVTSSTFSGAMESSSDGLEIYSEGAVTLSGVVAENPDGRNGVHIDNTYGDGGNKVSVSGKGNVFSNNDQYGIFINSEGNISLSNFKAQNNGDDGVYATNAYTGYTSSLKISSSKGFNDITGNSDNGLHLRSYGAVTISKVNASGNDNTNWLYLASNPGTSPVSISKSRFSDNLGVGLLLEGKGKLTLSSVTASRNGGNGITMYNDGAPGEDVILKNIIVSENQGGGLNLDSAGFVTITRVDAFGNSGSDGLSVNNSYGDEGITVTTGTFNDNLLNGADFDSNGPVNLTAITAQSNDQYGIIVDGNSNGQTVTISKMNANFNTHDGLNIGFTGDVKISLSNFIANGSQTWDSNGLYIRHDFGSTFMVTLTKSTILNNVGNGIELEDVGSYLLVNSLVFSNDIDNDEFPNSNDDIYIH